MSKFIDYVPCNFCGVTVDKDSTEHRCSKSYAERKIEWAETIGAADSANDKLLGAVSRTSALAGIEARDADLLPRLEEIREAQYQIKECYDQNDEVGMVHAMNDFRVAYRKLEQIITEMRGGAE